MSPDAGNFVKTFSVKLETGKPIAAICQTRGMGQADVVRGRRTTSSRHWNPDLPQRRRRGLDKEVVIDGSSPRAGSPADLPAFCTAVVDQFS